MTDTGISRQPEEVRGADAAVRERAARLHRDLPEQDLAQLVEQLLDEIGLADRHAAGRDDHVGCGRRIGERALERFRHVGHHAHVEHIAVEAHQHAVDRVAVAVVDLARAELRADGPELVAGREERDAKLAVDRDLADPERGHHAELRRVHELPGAEDELVRP